MRSRVATIDLGSNSCVLLVLERDASGFRRVTSELALTRLGEGLDGSGRLSEAAMARSLEALARFAERARSLGAEPVVAVGTAALREASNQAVMIEAAKRLGVALRPISGEEEAQLSFRAALDGLGGACVMIDVGGASTELAWGDDQGLDGRVSLKVGSVRLTERLGLTAPMNDTACDALLAACAAELEVVPAGLPGALVAVAGTATTTAQVDLGLSEYDPERVDHHEISRTSLDQIFRALAAKPLAARRADHGLPPGRADVFPAGLALLIATLDHLGREALLVRDRGVAWGEALRQFS